MIWVSVIAALVGGPIIGFAVARNLPRGQFNPVTPYVCALTSMIFLFVLFYFSGFQ